MLNVNGVQVYHVDKGTGTPTLFLHGAPDSADLWEPIIARMQSRVRAIAPDLPGFGRSVAPDNFDVSLDSMAHFVDGFVTALGIDTPVNLVVTDFGGVYGLAWAVRYPEKVRRVAITGGINFFPDYQWHSAAKIWRTPILGEVAVGLMNFSMFYNTMHKITPTLSREYWQHVYDLSFAKPSVKRMMMKLYRKVEPRHFALWQDGLKALVARVPMLVLWGDQDPFIAPSYAERFGAQQVEHFAEYGHWLVAEAPDTVAARLTAFFE